VHTIYEDLFRSNEMPCGVNAVVAIATNLGFNIEDSVIFNKASLDRGLFRSTKTTSHKDEEKSMGSNVERFERPGANVVGLRNANYNHLGEDGLPDICVRLDDPESDLEVAIIGKTMATTPVIATTGGSATASEPKRDLKVPVICR
jgi:DNA-directed RNA polymerase beta subunit